MRIHKRNSCSRLKQRLTLQQEIQASDGYGGYTRTWQNIADLWAEIIPLAGREGVADEKLEASLTHRVVLRYRSDITAGMRLLFENRAFNIRAVFNVKENNELLELLSEEGRAA